MFRGDYVPKILKKSRKYRESAVTTSTTQQFEIPSEMRVVAARSVERAKLDFKGYIRATEEATSTFEARVEASQLAAGQISKMAMNFALRDALVAFEFAQKIIQARNVSEFTKIFAEFVNPQMQVLSEQWRDLGETFSKAAIDSTNISKMGDLSS
jgi:hypothetical protein